MPVLADVRYALRLLFRAPVFSLTAVLSLALGIAASTSIFSLADALLFRPQVGITDPATLVDIARRSGGGLDNFGYPVFAAMRDRNSTLQGMAAVKFDPEIMGLGGSEAAERVYAGLVSGNYFDIVGTKPAIGRFFLPEEDRTLGTHPVVVLSHKFWARRFNADPAIVGNTIRLNNLPYTVVGVAEEGFTGTNLVGCDFWVPMHMDQHVRGADASLLPVERVVWHLAIGRLKPGVTTGQATSELTAIMKTYLRDIGDDRVDRWEAGVAPSGLIPAPIRGPVQGFIAVLGSLTGLVLLIACTNVASMLLARALNRRREVATRLAIGANRRRIITQLLTEGFTLALVAAAVSIPATILLLQVLGSFQPDLPIPITIDLRADARVLAFSMALAAATTIAFALLPALQSTRFELAPALHGANATADRRRSWLRQSLVAGQVAMALLLLVAAGLFLRSLQHAAAADVGFSTENIDLVSLDLKLGGYRNADQGRVALELIDRFRTIPGVVSASASRMIPLQGGGMGLGRLRVPGHIGPRGNDSIDADWDVVSPDYFRTLDMPIVKGRAFSDVDREGSTHVAIINEAMANALWPGRDAVGQQILHQYADNQERALQVVGVAKTAKYRSVGEAPRNFIYVPLSQYFMGDLNFFVKHATSETVIPSLHQTIRAYDADLPVIQAQTLEAATTIGLLPQRLAAWIAGGVGSIGLLLAAFGLYGLTAFSVAQRTRELAVRMALGATRESIMKLVLRQSGRLAITGACVGLVLSALVAVALQSLLIGIQPFDPLAFVIAAATLMVVLFLASWTPARRAARMDPMVALRSE